MLDIEVLKPTKTDSLYEFQCHLRPRRSLFERLRGRRPGDARSEPAELQFGYRAKNFSIRHHAVWDSFYPLFFLTRNGGPLFGKGVDQARVRFRFPVQVAVRDFFIRRAGDFGIGLEIDAAESEARFDGHTDGDILAFGGGKDSRLLLGLLREMGHEPQAITAKAANAKDVPEALVAESLHGALADRIMPSFMALGRRFFFGAGLGEVKRETPWQQYYDVASVTGLTQTSALLQSLGADTQMLAPLAVLPYNIIQRILHDRYPDLYRFQVSTRPGSRNEKSLHVALLKLVNGYAFEDQCSEPVFIDMLERFVSRQTASETPFGYRNYRETINREMRAIVWRQRDDPRFATVRERIPADWEARWIDYVHAYVWPQPDPAFMRVYGEYAQDVDEIDPGRKLWRVPI